MGLQDPDDPVFTVVSDTVATEVKRRKFPNSFDPRPIGTDPVKELAYDDTKILPARREVVCKIYLRKAVIHYHGETLQTDEDIECSVIATGMGFRGEIRQEDILETGQEDRKRIWGKV
jgi:hypothetical protein